MTVPSLSHIERCFSGAVPAVLCTASSDGIPNVTYISRAHRVDDERVALSNQFMSKTARNLAANPRASLLLVDPVTHDEFQLSLVYERTERRGHVFDRLRTDVDTLAALGGMQHVFRLRAADIFRVVDVAQAPPNPSGRTLAGAGAPRPPVPELAGVAHVVGCIARAGDLDVLVDTTLEQLHHTMGHAHSYLMLLDESGRRLYTIAVHGLGDDVLGAEVEIGAGPIGMAAERCEAIRVGNLRHTAKYTQSLRRSFEEAGIQPGRELPAPGLPDAQSRLAVPAVALGQLVGVLVVERREPAAYDMVDEQALAIVASALAAAIEHLRLLEREGADASTAPPPGPQAAATATVGVTGVTGGAAGPPAAVTAVRFFGVDGSVFLDGAYLIKGVAGRILWSLLQAHLDTGRVDFTNKELRLDPSLQMPGFKDNLESRLILLKRRLDERDAPIRLEKTGRGTFRLLVTSGIALSRGDS